MKELHGSAETEIAASQEQCFAVLADVEGYPRWHPDAIRSVEVIERDASGQPSRVATTLHAQIGPLARDFPVLMTVALKASSEVSLARVPHEPSDPERFEVNWKISTGPRSRVQLQYEALLEVPRLLPVGGLATPLAEGLVAAFERELSSS